MINIQKLYCISKREYGVDKQFLSENGPELSWNTLWIIKSRVLWQNENTFYYDINNDGRGVSGLWKPCN